MLSCRLAVGYLLIRRPGLSGALPRRLRNAPSLRRIFCFSDALSRELVARCGVSGGACSTGGDVISFLMKKENLPFVEAIQILGREAGVDLSFIETTARPVPALEGPK